MNSALYRVTFDRDRSIAGLKVAAYIEPAKHPGWRVEVTPTEVLIISPPAPAAIGDDSAAAQERDANGIEPSRAVIVTAIPRSLCALSYVADVDLDGRSGDDAVFVAPRTSPSPALVASRAPRLVAEVALVEQVEAAGVGTLLSGGAPHVAPQPKLPTRRVPPGGRAPVLPPPSEIALDEGGAA